MIFWFESLRCRLIGGRGGGGRSISIINFWPFSGFIYLMGRPFWCSIESSLIIIIFCLFILLYLIAPSRSWNYCMTLSCSMIRARSAIIIGAFLSLIESFTIIAYFNSFFVFINLTLFLNLLIYLCYWLILRLFYFIFHFWLVFFLIYRCTCCFNLLLFLMIIFIVIFVLSQLFFRFGFFDGFLRFNWVFWLNFFGLVLHFRRNWLIFLTSSRLVIIVFIL